MTRSPTWVKHLLEWFDKNRRRMPWRDSPTPYRVWISEVMLQQTQVETVIPYFERFLAAFPAPADLAHASMDEVLKLWEGLGYYSRARNLKRAAERIVDEHGGTLPSELSELRALPGFGAYTAAAVASIGFGGAVPVVDGNVLRVMTRFWAIPEDITKSSTRHTLQTRLLPLVKRADPGTFNQALMELGALVCRPVNPACNECPLRRNCRALKLDSVTQFPVRPPRRRVPHYNIGVGVVRRRDGKILIAKRRLDGMLGGLWEFPGGKQRTAESLEETVRREIQEETGIDVRVTDKLCTIKHAYSHFKITLHAYRCRHVSGRARSLGSDAVQWVKPDELDAFAFPTANRKLIAALAEN